jgi:hypothetical protein
MKNTFSLCLWRCTLAMGLIACHKDHNTPTPTPTVTPILGKMTIKTSYPDSSKTLSNVELIITEPGGKPLLDTVVPVNTPITATLSTDAKLVNATTVVYNPAYTQYDVYSYRGVNPSTWAIIGPPQFYYLFKPVPWVNTSPATVVYTHPPALTDPTNYGSMWMNNYGPGYSLITPYASNNVNYQPGVSLTINYNNYANNTLYLLLPQLGLYNFHKYGSALDSVDLTHMDTAVQVTYAKPPSTSTALALLRGFLDTTNLANTVQLWSTPYDLPVDLEYPAKGVQAYELSYYASNTSQEFFEFYCYGSSVPTTLPFPGNPSYIVTANQPDSFSVAFPGSRPSLYIGNWLSGSTNLTVYASPDSGAVHPFTLLTALNSKMLAGQSFGSPVAQSLMWQQLTGLDYAGGLNYYFNPSLYATIRLNGSSALVKTFQ